MNKYLGKISKQRFDILPEYKILVIHIGPKVFNTVVKKWHKGLLIITKADPINFVLLSESAL